MNTIYLRKERIHFYEHIDGYPTGLDVVAYYRDKGAKEKLCVNSWSDRPTKRNRYVMYNCNKYKAQWLPDLI